MSVRRPAETGEISTVLPHQRYCTVRRAWVKPSSGTNHTPYLHRWIREEVSPCYKINKKVSVNPGASESVQILLTVRGRQWAEHFIKCRIGDESSWMMWINANDVNIYIYFYLMVWLCGAATSPRLSSSHVNRQRTRGMLDSVTSRPERSYSALSSARPMLRLPRAPPHPTPAWGPSRVEKNTPLSLHTHTYERTHTCTYTDWQVLPFLPPLHSCQSSKFLLFLQFQATLVWKGFNKPFRSTLLIFICSK